MTISAIESLELNLKEAKQRINTGQALLRLQKNRDFQEIITHGYLEKEAIRLVHLKASFDKQDTDTQIAINKAIDSIGLLKNYLDNVSFSHDQAMKELEMTQETLEEIYQEGLNQ